MARAYTVIVYLCTFGGAIGAFVYAVYTGEDFVTCVGEGILGGLFGAIFSVGLPVFILLGCLYGVYYVLGLVLGG